MGYLRVVLGAFVFPFLCVALHAADEVPLKREPKPVIPIGLFTIEDASDHLILAGQADGGVYIYEVNAGIVTQLELTKQATAYYDGSYNLYLENGWRIALPNSQEISSLDFPFGASIVYPDRPRDELHSIKITKEIAEAHGILNLIDPKYFEAKPTPKNESKIAVYLKRPENTDILIVSQAGKDLRLDTATREAAEKIVAAYPGEAHSADGGLFNDVNVIWIDKRVFATVEAQLLAIPGLTVSSVQQLLDKTAQLKADPADIETTLKSARLALFELSSVYDDTLFVASRDGRVKLLEAATEAERAKGFEEAVAKNIAAHPFQKNFLAPLSRAAHDLLKRVHGLGVNEGYEFVMDGMLQAGGAGMDLIAQRFSYTRADGKVVDGNYLDFWLNFHRDVLLDADRRYQPGADLDAKEWRMSKHSGGMFSNLGLSGNNIFVFSTADGKPGSRRHMDSIETAPLVLLGSDDPKVVRAAKRAVIQFIMDADKIADRQLKAENALKPFLEFRWNFSGDIEKYGAPVTDVLQAFWETGKVPDEKWEKLDPAAFSGVDRTAILTRLRSVKNRAKMTEDREPYRGNDLLHKFISRMPYYYREFEKVPGFSGQRYYTSAQEILFEVLTTSAETIESRGTYEFLLDTSLGMSKSIRASFGKRSTVSQEHVSQADRMDRLILSKLLSAVRFVKMTEGRGGEASMDILMSPDAWKVWRNRQGR